jgi:hypothetical protein
LMILLKMLNVVRAGMVRGFVFGFNLDAKLSSHAPSFGQCRGTWGAPHDVVTE